jgi:hypothetical protein
VQQEHGVGFVVTVVVVSLLTCVQILDESLGKSDSTKDQLE